MHLWPINQQRRHLFLEAIADFWCLIDVALLKHITKSLVFVLSLQKAEQKNHIFSSVQFSSVAQSCPTLYNPMNHSTPGLPVHHQLPEFTQAQVHRLSDAIQPSHPLSSPSPPAPNPSQHQSLFQWVNSMWPKWEHRKNRSIDAWKREENPVQGME